jgi:hypothetical protein
VLALAVDFFASLARVVAEEHAPVAPIIDQARPSPAGPRLSGPEEPVAAIIPLASAASAPPPRRPAAAARAIRVVSPAPNRAAIIAVIEAAAREFGQDPARMVSVAMC